MLRLLPLRTSLLPSSQSSSTFLVDSDRLVTPQALEFNHLAHGNRRFTSRHARDESTIERGYNPDDDSGKANITALEYASQTR